MSVHPSSAASTKAAPALPAAYSLHSVFDAQETQRLAVLVLRFPELLEKPLSGTVSAGECVKPAAQHYRVLPEGWVIVFNPRRNVTDAPFEELCREIAKVFAKCAQLSSRS